MPHRSRTGAFVELETATGLKVRFFRQSTEALELISTLVSSGGGPMIQIPPNASVREPVSFRNGIDGTAALARTVLEKEPMDGALFVFRNPRRHMLRVLFYDGSGFWLCTKRLSKGCFSVARGRRGEAVLTVTRSRAAGIDLGRRPGELRVPGPVAQGRYISPVCVASWPA